MHNANNADTKRVLSWGLIFITAMLFLSIHTSCYALTAENICIRAAQFNIVPSTSHITLEQNDSTVMSFTITNNTQTLPLGLKNLALAFNPSKPGLTATVTNNCQFPLLKGGTCLQYAQITTSANTEVPSGDYKLTALVCDAGSPTKFCASTCSPIIVTVNPPKNTTINVTPNPVTVSANGANAVITIQNIGTVTAHNITFSAPGLGVQVVNSTCSSPLAVGASCSAEVQPGSTSGVTSFTISGNFNTFTEAVIVGPAPPPGNTTLSASVTELALSARTPHTPRTITITNTGTNPTQSLIVTPSGLPPGTSISSDTCSGNSLAAGANCAITITPGSIASSTCSVGTVPTPGTVSVSSTNVTTPTSTDILVLDFGCIYQDGYIFSIDDTTSASGSIGGKVVGMTDQTSGGSSLMYWSAQGPFPAPAVADSIPGIYQNSTVSGGDACNGNSDGSCDSAQIINFYNSQLPPPPPGSNAADVCHINSSTNFSDWVLPAICEMGPNAGTGANCSTIPNIQTNVEFLTGTGCAAGTACLSTTDNYWSSTESNLTNSSDYAWSQTFNNIGATQQEQNKGIDGTTTNRVRCIRLITQP